MQGLCSSPTPSTGRASLRSGPSTSPSEMVTLRLVEKVFFSITVGNKINVIFIIINV